MKLVVKFHQGTGVRSTLASLAHFVHYFRQLPRIAVRPLRQRIADPDRFQNAAYRVAVDNVLVTEQMYPLALLRLGSDNTFIGEFLQSFASRASSWLWRSRSPGPGCWWH